MTPFVDSVTKKMQKIIVHLCILSSKLFSLEYNWPQRFPPFKHPINIEITNTIVKFKTTPASDIFLAFLMLPLLNLQMTSARTTYDMPLAIIKTI